MSRLSVLVEEEQKSPVRGSVLGIAMSDGKVFLCVKEEGGLAHNARFEVL